MTKPFEIGKTYKTSQGGERTVVARVPDGRLIVEDQRNWSSATWHVLSYRNPDGTFEKNHDMDLVPEKEVEQRYLAVSPSICECYTSSLKNAQAIQRKWSDVQILELTWVDGEFVKVHVLPKVEASK